MPYTAYLSGMSWDEASGKTGSGKKFDHKVISGADFAAQPTPCCTYHSSDPLLHGRFGKWTKIQQCWVRIPSPFLSSTHLEVTGGVHVNNRLGGNSLLDCVVYARVAGAAGAKYGRKRRKLISPSSTRVVWRMMRIRLHVFSPQSDLGKGLRSAASLRCPHHSSHPMRVILDFENSGVLGVGLIWRGRCGVLVSVMTWVASPLCGLALWFCLTGAVR